MKKGALAILVAGALLSASACGNSNDKSSGESSPTPSQGGAPVTLTFSTFNAWWTTGNLEKLVKMYEEKTGNKVDAQIFPDDQFFNVIRTKLSSGEPPDVFAIWPDISNFNTDQLEPLTGEWTSRIDMERAKKIGYASNVDGKLYTAPYGGLSIQGLMYNKKVFEKAGISVPLKTYQEFQDAAAKIKSLGITPLTVPAKDDWTSQIAFYTGSHYLAASDPSFAPDLATNKAKLGDKPALIDMMNRVIGLKEAGFVNDDYLSTTMAMAEEALANETTAMVFGGDWLYTDFLTNYSDKAENIGMTAVSWGDDSSLVGITKGASGNGLFVPKQSQNKQAALDFVDFAMSEEAIKALYELTPGVNELGYEANIGPWQKEMLALVDAGTAQDIPSMIDAIRQVAPEAGMTLGPVAESFAHAFGSGDVKQILENWYKEYSKLNAAKKVPGF